MGFFYVFKIINSQIDSTALYEKIDFKINRTSSRSKTSFYVDFCSTKFARNCFITRAMSSCNTFLNDIDIFSVNLNSYLKIDK